MRTDLIDLFLGHANAEEKMDNTLIQYGGVLDRFDSNLPVSILMSVVVFALLIG